MLFRSLLLLFPSHDRADGRMVTLDRMVMLESGVTYGFLIRHDINDTVEEVGFTVPVSGEYETITITGSFERQPMPLEVYSLGPVSKIAKPFRIIAITRSKEFTRKITAVEYYDEIYNDDYIVSDVAPYYWDGSMFDIVLDEIPSGRSATIGLGSLSVSWTGSYPSYNVDYAVDGNRGVFFGRVNGGGTTISNLPLNKEIFVSVCPTSNASMKKYASIVLKGEYSAIYENGCYEYGLFATPNQQELAGHKTNGTMWIQEPNYVVGEFIDLEEEGG